MGGLYAVSNSVNQSECGHTVGMVIWLHVIGNHCLVHQADWLSLLPELLIPWQNCQVTERQILVCLLCSYRASDFGVLVAFTNRICWGWSLSWYSAMFVTTKLLIDSLHVVTYVLPSSWSFRDWLHLSRGVCQYWKPSSSLHASLKWSFNLVFVQTP